MRFLINALEVLSAYVRIGLGSGQVAVSQQFLNCAEVASPVEEMGRKGMAKGMRADALLQSGQAHPSGDDQPSSPV